MLEVSDRLAVIIGGGAVAARKAAGLVEAGGTRIRAVAPTFDASLHPRVERVAEPYAPRHLDGAELVFAATDSPEVNERVVRDARARRLLVNRADEGESSGDFIVPASFRHGPITLAVAAGSPALSAAIRKDLARYIDSRHMKMADAMQRLRPLVRDSGLEPEARRRILRELAGEAALEALRQGGLEGLTAWLGARHPELKL
jgi:precorrin-2 dehydrogenase/sirohydrochlorin ferrochelatase